jgi:hypothetical protein
MDALGMLATTPLGAAAIRSATNKAAVVVEEDDFI